MARFWDDPYREQSLEEAATEAQRRSEMLRSALSAQRAQQLALMAQTYPTMSSQLSQGVFGAGEEGSSSTLATLAMREERVRQEEQGAGGGGWFERNLVNPLIGTRDWAFDKFKTGVRGLFLAGEGMWEEGFARPLRTVVGGLSAGRSDWGKLWSEAGSSDMLAALGELRARRPVNIGSGFIPKSEELAETEDYQALIDAGATPEQALAEIEGRMGREITRTGLEQREQLTFRGAPISLGRTFAGIFTEPGTKPYFLMSGLVDVAARLALDPMAKTLRGLSMARRGAKGFSTLEATAADLSPAALAARNFAVGLIPGVRKTVRTQSVDAWLMSGDGRRVAEVVARTTGDDAFSLIKDMLQRNNPTSVSRGLIADLAKETDPQKVAALLRPHLGLSVLEKPMHTTMWAQMGLPSMSRGAGALVGGEWGSLGGFGVAVKHQLAGTKLGRLFEKMPGRHIALDDLDDGLGQLDDFMVSAGFSASTRSKHMAEWAKLREGNYTGAMKVMKAVMDDLEVALIGKGIPPVLAKRVTYLYKDTESMRQYFTSHIGTPGWFPGSEVIDLGGEKVVMPTAQLISEYLGRAIPLPDAVQLRRAFSKVDKMHRYVIGARRGVYRQVRGKEGGFQGAVREATEELDALDRGALEIAMDFYMTKVWKPLVLLRLAWPVRVIGEEQLRMAGAGLDSLFSHPISYLSWQIGRGKTGVQKVMKKVGGGDEATQDEFIELMASREGRDAMTRGTGGFIDEQGVVRTGKVVGGRKGYANYVKTGPKRPYLNAWSGHLADLAEDPIAAAVAGDFHTTSQRFWDGNLAGVRRTLMQGSSKKASVLGTRQGADLYLRSIQARLAAVSGGTFKVVRRGTTKTFRPGIDNWQEAEYVISGGNSTLIAGVATGKIGNVKLAGINSKAEVEELRRLLGGKYFFEGAAPHVVGGPSWLDAAQGNIYDRAVEVLFSSLMSKPTNYLSRSPAFRQFYWERIEALAPRMTDAALARAVKAAKAAKLGRTAGPSSWREEGGVVARLEKIRGAAKGEGIIDNILDADELAKAYALHSTKKLLYDLSTKHRATQILRNVFPFGEAWVEILTSWGRLVYRNPQIIRRGQQMVSGARGSGVFYTDPVTNEEVFAYPGGGLLANWMFGDDAPASMKLQGMVQGLNLAAGSYMPGFGPMVQIPTSLFLPDTPNSDGLRRIILPFGNVKAGSPGGLIDAALPAWMKKALQALESPEGSTEMARLQGNTTIDVLRAMLLSGRWNLDTPESAMSAVKSASKKATVLALIRGAAQFILPTGPSVAFQAEDKEGKVWYFQTIAKEYYDKLQNEFDGDESAAMRWFIGAYGLNPFDIVTPKTQQVYRRHTTQEGDEWARQNLDLFEKFAYPSTAFFAQPDDIDAEFHYQAYIRQLEEGSRVGYTPEQWAVARNQTLGRIRYQRTKEVLGDRTDSYARQYLSEMRTWLSMQYPGYGLPNVGTAVKPDSKMMMEELGRWADDPRMRDSDTGKGYRAYMTAVGLAEQMSLRAGLSKSGYQSAERMRGTRVYLRNQAEMIMAQYPNFAGLWRYVLEPQLTNDGISLPTDTTDTLLDRLTGGSI